MEEHDSQCTCYECLHEAGYGRLNTVANVRSKEMAQVTCPRCFGYGHLVADEAVIVASWTDNDGMATVIHADCPRCNGRGQIPDPREERAETWFEIDDWRAFARDELYSNDYHAGAPPRENAEAEDIYQTEIKLIEKDPCPRCGGKVTYKGYHKRYQSEYGMLNRGWSYRAFGACHHCNMAFEF